MEKIIIEGNVKEVELKEAFETFSKDVELLNKVLVCKDAQTRKLVEKSEPIIETILVDQNLAVDFWIKIVEEFEKVPVIDKVGVLSDFAKEHNYESIEKLLARLYYEIRVADMLYDVVAADRVAMNFKGRDGLGVVGDAEHELYKMFPIFASLKELKEYTHPDRFILFAKELHKLLLEKINHNINVDELYEVAEPVLERAKREEETEHNSDKSAHM